MAEHVTTPYVTFTDAHHIIAGPVYLLMDDSGSPVLPYIAADSSFCTTMGSCTSELRRLRPFSGSRWRIIMTPLRDNFPH
ncbi:unnamed protein product [Effrenium voratum]|nr:unnamed protein product [Effrenium voratum]